MGTQTTMYKIVSVGGYTLWADGMDYVVTRPGAGDMTMREMIRTNHKGMAEAHMRSAIAEDKAQAD